MYGGFASYDYIEFSGGALPLGLVGLVSFSGAGPALGTFEPPYGMVFGSGFFFEIGNSITGCVVWFFCFCTQGLVTAIPYSSALLSQWNLRRRNAISFVRNPNG